MKLSRLWQPRHRLFAPMLASNALGLFWGVLLRNDGLNGAWFALVAVIALANAALGLWLAWRLVRDEPPAGG